MPGSMMSDEIPKKWQTNFADIMRSIIKDDLDTLRRMSAYTIGLIRPSTCSVTRASAALPHDRESRLAWAEHGLARGIH